MGTEFAHRDTLDILVNHGQSIVTYKALSRKLNCPVNTAKQLLFDFLSTSSTPLHATYCVTGQRKDSPTLLSVNVVSQEHLESTKQQFLHHRVHVYSIEPAPLKDLATSLVTVDYEVLSTTENPSEFSPIHNPTIKRIEHRQPQSLAKAQPTVAKVPPPKPAPAPAAASSSTSSAKPSATTSTKQDKKGGKQPSAASFFGKSTGASTAKKPAATKAVAAPSKPEESVNKPTPAPVAKAAPPPAQVVAVPAKRKTTHKDFEIDFSDDDETDALMVQAMEEATKSAPSTESTSNTTTTKPPPARKRKVIVDEDEEEAEREEEDMKVLSRLAEEANKDEMEQEEESKDTDVVMEESTSASSTKPSSPTKDNQLEQQESQQSDQPRRVRKRRKVKRTKHFTDDDGFIVAKDVEEWESYSEDETVVPKKPVAPAPASSSSSNTNNKTGNKKAGGAKGKNAAAAAGQKSLLSFFGKK